MGLSFAMTGSSPSRLKTRVRRNQSASYLRTMFRTFNDFSPHITVPRVTRLKFCAYVEPRKLGNSLSARSRRAPSDRGNRTCHLPESQSHYLRISESELSTAALHD